MNRKLILKYTVVAIVVFGLSFGLGTIITQQIMQYGIMGMLSNGLNTNGILSGERVNILIIGQDARPNENVTRSDTLIVASIDPKLKKAVLLWIPRDTKWESSKYGTQKINAALAYGGAEGAVKAVNEILDIKLDYYVQLNFEAFRRVVDGLGGVEINVENRLYHADPENPELEIDLEPGLQTLNGKESLAYVRYRSYPMGDMDRDTHQAIFVKALADKALSPLTVIKLPEIIMAIHDNLVTDMSITDMAKYASWAPSFKSESIITQTLPGFYENGYNSSGTLIWCYWKPDEDIAGTIIESLYAGKKFEVYDQTAEANYDSRSSSYDEDSTESDNSTADDGKDTNSTTQTGTAHNDTESSLNPGNNSQSNSSNPENLNNSPVNQNPSSSNNTTNTSQSSAEDTDRPVVNTSNSSTAH